MLYVFAFYMFFPTWCAIGFLSYRLMRDQFRLKAPLAMFFGLLCATLIFGGWMTVGQPRFI